MAPEAVAAVDGACAGRNDERPSLVFVQHTCCRAALQVPDRVAREALRSDAFGEHRKNLQKQRVAGVGFAHLRGEIARYPQREVAGACERPVDERRIEVEQLAELPGVGDRGGELLLPRRRTRLELAGKGGCGYHLRPLSAPTGSTLKK